jgi:hypothetical protein
VSRLDLAAPTSCRARKLGTWDARHAQHGRARHILGLVTRRASEIGIDLPIRARATDFEGHSRADQTSREAGTGSNHNHAQFDCLAQPQQACCCLPTFGFGRSWGHPRDRDKSAICLQGNRFTRRHCILISRVAGVAAHGLGVLARASGWPYTACLDRARQSPPRSRDWRRDSGPDRCDGARNIHRCSPVSPTRRKFGPSRARSQSEDRIHDRATRPAGKVYGILIPPHPILAIEWRNRLGGHQIVAAEVPQPDRRSARARGRDHAGELAQPLAEQRFRPKKSDGHDSGERTRGARGRIGQRCATCRQAPSAR